MARRRLLGYPVRGESWAFYCPRHAAPSIPIRIIRRISVALAMLGANQLRGRYAATRHQQAPRLAQPEWPRLTVITSQAYSSGRAA